MKCPHCKNELQIPNYVYLNADAYGNTAKTVTECCGKMVNVRPVRVYDITRNDSAEMDDWGVEIKKDAKTTQP